LRHLTQTVGGQRLRQPIRLAHGETFQGAAVRWRVAQGRYGTLRKAPLLGPRVRVCACVGYLGEIALERSGAKSTDRSEGKRGLFGAVVGRAEAQVVRLAALYAVMTESHEIRREAPPGGACALGLFGEERPVHLGDATGDRSRTKSLALSVPPAGRHDLNGDLPPLRAHT
jgi:hypothetical protein